LRSPLPATSAGGSRRHPSRRTASSTDRMSPRIRPACGRLPRRRSRFPPAAAQRQSARPNTASASLAPLLQGSGCRKILTTDQFHGSGPQRGRTMKRSRFTEAQIIALLREQEGRGFRQLRPVANTASARRRSTNERRNSEGWKSRKRVG